MFTSDPGPLPDARGRFGDFGGRFVPETLIPALDELERAFRDARADPAYRESLARLLCDYAGRPTPLFRAERLSAALGAAARDSNSDDARESALASVREAAAAMASLGEEAQAPIITPALVVIAALASAVGCAAKPSGAGGGDCAVLFAFGDAAQSRALQLLRARELQAVSLLIAPHTPGLPS